MTGPPLQDIDRALAQIRSSQQPGGEDIEAALAKIRGKPPTVRPDVASALARNRSNASGDLGAAIANPGQQARFIGQVAGSHLLNAAQGIPGAELAEAGASSLLSGKPYETALGDLRARIKRDVGDTPLTTAEQVAGGGGLLGRALGAIPKAATAVGRIGQAGAVGAGLGAADQALNADLSQSLAQRAGRTGLGALAGGAAGVGLSAIPEAAQGSIGRTIGLGRRVMNAPTIGAEEQAQRAGVRASDKSLYGAAEQEAQKGGGTSPEIQAVLAHPRIAPLANDIRESNALTGWPNDDASIVLQMHRELSEKQSPLVAKITGATQGAPLTERQSAEIGALKQMLRDAGQGLMPSFPVAVATHAAGMGEREMTLEGARRARLLMAGKPPNLKKIGKSSDESALTWAQGLTPAQQEQALTGALAAGKEASHGAFNLPHNLMAAGGGGLGFHFGGPIGAAIGAGSVPLAQTGMRLGRLLPLTDALEGRAQLPGNTMEMLKALGYLNAPLANK